MSRLDLRTNLADLAKAICETEVDELDCDALVDRLAEYLEAVETERTLTHDLRRIEQHLAVCGDCAEELRLLRRALVD